MIIVKVNWSKSSIELRTRNERAEKFRTCDICATNLLPSFLIHDHEGKTV